MIKFFHYSRRSTSLNNSGNLVSGNKNGKAVQWIIHLPNGTKYYCDGTFKKFCRTILRKYKPQPHRKYMNEILKLDVPVNGWYFKKVNDSFNYSEKNYIKYEI